MAWAARRWRTRSSVGNGAGGTRDNHRDVGSERHFCWPPLFPVVRRPTRMGVYFCVTGCLSGISERELRLCALKERVAVSVSGGAVSVQKKLQLSSAKRAAQRVRRAPGANDLCFIRGYHTRVEKNMCGRLCRLSIKTCSGLD